MDASCRRGLHDGLAIRHLFNVPIHALGMRDVLAIVDDAIRRRGRLLIGVVNAAKMVNMRRDPELARAVLGSDLILADGMAVVWACRLLRRNLPERVPGIDLMESLLEHSRRHGYRVFCLGATPKVLAQAVAEMEARHPGVQIVGYHHGYFSRKDERAIVSDIKTSAADILFVAMTSPEKERFMARWQSELAVPVCHGVGGSFDVLAGKVKRAPRLWQRLGVEWLYRVIQEPRRMFRRYAETNTIFCWMVLVEWVKQIGRYPR